MAHVLFATDLSESAGIAERLIAGIDWPAATTIRVVTVVPWIVLPTGSPWLAAGPFNAEEIEAAQLATARTAVAEAAARLVAAGRAGVSWVVMRGHPADAIVDVARRESADLIVVGSRGLNAIEGALLGSVSEGVADRAPCPVLIARTDRIRRSLVADDGSPGSELALDYVGRRRHLMGEVTELLDVQGHGNLWAESFEIPVDAHTAQTMADDQLASWRRVRAHLEADATSLRESGQDTQVVVEDGSPGDVITNAALAWHADLVVVGSRHRAGVTRLVLGSVGRHVLHHSHCSVLLVGRVMKPADDKQAVRDASQVGIA